MNRRLLAILLITFGILTFLLWFGVINTALNEILGIIFLFYGIAANNRSFAKADRKRLILSAVIFLVGIVILVQTKFEFPDKRGIVFVSILFISGSILVMLFFENMRLKNFAYTGILLIGLSCFSLLLLKPLGLFRFTNVVANWAGFLWPLILIVFGMVIFSVRKK